MQYIYRLFEAAAATMLVSGCQARCSSLAWKSRLTDSASGAAPLEVRLPDERPMLKRLVDCRNRNILSGKMFKA